jgi:hypothetical protein
VLCLGVQSKNECAWENLKRLTQGPVASVSSRASPPHRPQEHGLAQPADTSITGLAAALALLFEVAARISLHVNAELIDPRSFNAEFLMYQSGIDFKCPYSNRPLMPLTPLNRLNAIFLLAGDRIAKSPYLFNWSMSSASGLLPLPQRLPQELTHAVSAPAAGSRGTWQPPPATPATPTPLNEVKRRNDLHGPTLTTPPVDLDSTLQPEDRDTLTELHKRYAITTADKADGNFVVMCKKHYIRLTIEPAAGTRGTWQPPPATPTPLGDGLSSHPMASVAEGHVVADHAGRPSVADSDASSAYGYLNTFSSAELHAATDDFGAHRRIGEGGFGAVYSGRVRTQPSQRRHQNVPTT